LTLKSVGATACLQAVLFLAKHGWTSQPWHAYQQYKASQSTKFEFRTF